MLQARIAAGLALMFLALPGLSGCAGAPSIPLAGAYFPAWLLCALVGVLGAALARALFVMSGVAQLLPLQLFVCTAIGVAVAALLWWVWVGL
ncbi:Uncharacterised protein family protein [Variovorax sp. HW608]|uniref:YtcA family lipoprotein n=1 Tax=Variovorax sp. HW608 TaxID=1034889 RepID=UPI00081FCF6F|nr:YtcA family lipoprotein [Variovorax sp. HW608]SCK25750.1 Uncharacterised protein family protein [Variovorax sp. HW608]